MRIILSGKNRMTEITYNKMETEKQINLFLKFIKDNIKDISTIEIRHKK